MTSRPKVTIFAHSSSLAGGGEGALLEMVSFLKDKVNLRIIIPEEGDFSKELSKLKVKFECIYIPQWTLWSVGADYSAIVRKSIENINTHLNEFNPDVCITNTSVIPWGAFVAKARGIPHVWFVHEMLDARSEVKYSLPLRQVENIINELSDIVVANSEYCLEELAKIIPKEKILTIMPINHLDSMKSSASSKVVLWKNTTEKYPIVLISGRILSNKGQEDAVNALGILEKKGIHIKLLLLGEAQPEYKKMLLELAKKHAVEKTIYFSPFTLSPVSYLKQADIVITTSRLESFGRSTVEAMMLGKPVIGADNSSTAVIIKHEYNGLLYKTGSAEDLANQIQRLLMDKKTRDSLVKGAIKTVVGMKKMNRVSHKKLIDFLIASKAGRVAAKGDASSVEYLLQLIGNTTMLTNSEATSSNTTKYLAKVKGRIKTFIAKEAK